MATETVKTFELKRNGIVLATGSVKTLAEFAALEMYRKDRDILESDLDWLEKTLRKEHAATFRGFLFDVSQIVEEYEADEE